jgi:urocanate hydratase
LPCLVTLAAAALEKHTTTAGFGFVDHHTGEREKALERAASARTRCGVVRAASARAHTAKRRARGTTRAEPPVVPTARAPSRDCSRE